ncbi:hypothetical protein QR680_003156 [Steinernema hermaphroditum]|uniref:RRM domain-containing protein n=1 Tax=Steinernema hermaphroditum TaxID=289476 RepID=A0AA39LJK0_9BILA|nr:hypothetical protein QR680_003156 [Steinernema hermaphroditum]
MSRLIIKGLPGSITEDKLRRHFAGHGAITDCQLKYTRDGVFRCFACSASTLKKKEQKVANHFNNTFIGTTRITVEESKKTKREEPMTAKRSSTKEMAVKDQYLGGFRVKIDEAPAGQGQSMHQEDDEPQLTPKEESEKTTAAILDIGRLFVRNLPYICTNDDLLFLFKPFGEIAECENIIDKKTGKSKGFAVITFVFPENAAAAYAALDGSVFKGRMLHLLPGDEKRDDKALDPSNQKGLSAFQKEKQAKLKANAGNAHSWHALFLGANAVADTLANKLAVSKADLLTGDDESSAGVRLALAETRLVRETREFLLQHGVKLNAFSRPATKRSDTVIIVKNLPANRDDEELKRMFGRFCDLKQFIMPPEGGVSAIVEMGNSVDAKKAFASLAYSRFRNQPLYLEWAPLDVVDRHRRPSVLLAPHSGEDDASERNVVFRCRRSCSRTCRGDANPHKLRPHEAAFFLFTQMNLTSRKSKKSAKNLVLC